MAEIHLLPSGFNYEGAERLATALQQRFVTNADLSPRWPQIQALGLSLQQLSRDLEREIDGIATKLNPTPEAESFCDSLHRLADAFTRLGAIAQVYPSAT